MRELGYTDISAHKLANLAILGVTPTYVRELRAAGLGESLAAGSREPPHRQHHPRKDRRLQTPRLHARRRSELSDFGIHGVTPKCIEELRAMGYTNLTPHQLIEMRIFGVTPDFIRKMEASGYKAVPVDKLIKIKMSGADELVTGGGKSVLPLVAFGILLSPCELKSRVAADILQARCLRSTLGRSWRHENSSSRI